MKYFLLHFKIPMDLIDYIYTFIEPMHLKDGLGDLFGLLREDMPPKDACKRLSEELGRGECEYLEYDRLITKKATEWIQNQDSGSDNSSEPWVLFVSFVSPHYPLVSPPYYYDLYNDINLPYDNYPSQPPGKLHSWVRGIRESWPYDDYMDNEKRKIAVQAYYGMCSFMDSNVGQIVNELKQSNFYDNTTIIYASDHGESLGNRGLWGKMTMYEDSSSIPLIISGKVEDKSNLYLTANEFVVKLQKNDYDLDEKNKNAILTDVGIDKIEKLAIQKRLLKNNNFYDPQNLNLVHHVNQSLKANLLFQRDKDYIVKDEKVQIIDEFTGRILSGRRFSDGLHQAIEAKENVAIQEENQTLASITYQNYFKLYKKISGCTGTAVTESEEFFEIYNLSVVVIPTNKKMIRNDFNDQIFRTEKEKNLMAPRVINKFSKEINKKTPRFNEINKKIKEYQKFIKNNFDYVGENFVYEARSIHYGHSKKKRNIFGTASKNEIKELKEEGIEAETIPWVEDKSN